MALLGDDPGAGGTTPAARPGGLARLDEPLGGQAVDVAAHGRLGEAEPLDEAGDAHRPLLAHDTQHPVAGPRLEDVHVGINHTPMLGNCRAHVKGRFT